MKYGETWEFYEGLAGLRKNNKLGFINSKGKLEIALKYLGERYVYRWYRKSGNN